MDIKTPTSKVIYYHIFIYVFPPSTQKEKRMKNIWIIYLNGYISEMFDHIPGGGSSTKYIGIIGISLYIYRLSRRKGTKLVR
jgi:hypothetical protein